MTVLIQKSPHFYRWLFYIISAVSIILISLVAALLMQISREKRAHEIQLNALVLELAVTITQMKEKQEYLDRLVRDDEFRNRVIREKMGHARPDEIIYIFQDKKNPDAKKRN